MGSTGSSQTYLAAAAGPLEDAKRAGHIGEKFDGYLGVVDSSAP